MPAKDRLPAGSAPPTGSSVSGSVEKLHPGQTKRKLSAATINRALATLKVMLKETTKLLDERIIDKVRDGSYYNYVYTRPNVADMTAITNLQKDLVKPKK